MDIYLLDREYQTVCILDGFSSLLWNRRYKSPGDFQLVTTDPKYFVLARNAKYVYRADAAEVGLLKAWNLPKTKAILKWSQSKADF